MEERSPGVIASPKPSLPGLVQGRRSGPKIERPWHRRIRMVRSTEEAELNRITNEVFAVFAICNVFDIPEPTDLGRPDHPYDLILPGGRKTIAKSDGHSGDPFLIDDDHTHQLHTWDVGILVRTDIENRSAELISWISHLEFWDKCQLHILPDGRRALMVEPDEMNTMEELMVSSVNCPNASG
jgi:hypothetical protein